MSDDEDIAIIRSKQPPQKMRREINMRDAWAGISFAGTEEEPDQQLIDLATVENNDDDAADDSNPSFGIEEEWDGLGGPGAQKMREEVMKIVKPLGTQAFWRVVGMPNARASLEHFVPPVGFALGVSTTNTKAKIPYALIHPDKLGYGLTAVRVPYPEECQGATTAFYAATDAELKAKLASLRWSAETAMDFDGSFVGVYTENRDCGYYYRRTMWVIVQDGSKRDSMLFYDRLERQSAPDTIARWQVMVDEGVKLAESVGMKRDKQLALFFDCAGVNFGRFRESALVVRQPAYSFSMTEDALYYVYYARCFPVCKTKAVLIGDTPLRGFTLLCSSSGEPWSILRRNLFAFPYGTGSTALETDMVDKSACPCVFGNDARGLSKRFIIRGAAFMECETSIGREGLQPNSLLVPYVVRLNDAVEVKTESVW